MDTKRALEIIGILENHASPTKKLDFKNPLELLVATVLAAQCTDARVNMVTEKLFKEYKTVKDYANADIKKFEEDIHSTGFYKNKAKNIIAAATMIESDFNGKVPDTMEELIQLPGIGRKTANIILNHAFNKVVGIAVDTHVGRLSQRLGFTKNKDPNKIEEDLLKLIPQEKWSVVNSVFIDHGRAVCTSRKPKCPDCAVKDLCPSSAAFIAEYHK